MSIQGYFDPDDPSRPAPYVEGLIYFPGLGVGGKLHFLVDTGSDRTCLNGDDVRDLGIDYQALAARQISYSRGVGGSTGYYREPALLMFRDASGADRFCQLIVGICEETNDPFLRRIPSLLGRDFLNRCDVRLNSSLNLVSLEPWNVEGDFVVPPPER